MTPEPKIARSSSTSNLSDSTAASSAAKGMVVPKNLAQQFDSADAAPHPAASGPEGWENLSHHF